MLKQILDRLPPFEVEDDGIIYMNPIWFETIIYAWYLGIVGGTLGAALLVGQY